MKRLQLIKIKRIIKNGGIIAYPTEAVYGLGCDPANYQAVQKLYKIKNRPMDKGLIIVAASLKQLEGWIKVPDYNIWQRIKQTWPGSVTWVFTAGKLCPPWISGRSGTVAVRISANETIMQICQVLEHPLVSTSANISGHKPAHCALSVRLRLGKQLDFVVTGKTDGMISPSEIYIANNGQRIR